MHVYTRSGAVHERGLAIDERAQVRASPHRYNARRPNKLYGGPPPRVAFVESVLGETG
jgi:hypothetical protein